MYIKDALAISPQATFDGTFQKGKIREIVADKYEAIEPNYLEFIPKGMLRRMGKVVRMGIGVALPLMERNHATDGIIIGSANGGLEDCIKFLNQIVDYNEGMLTPTNFVQSTPNALAGQLAVLLKNNGYNNTHVNGSLAFENTILDALLFLENKPKNSSLLIGGVEEISTYNFNIDFLNKRYKNKKVQNLQLLKDNSEGTICGEGASMFIVSNDPQNASCKIVDTAQVCSTDTAQIQAALERMLQRNQLSKDAIQYYISGKNGDVRYDHYYVNMHDFIGKNAKEITYKQYIGDYRTATAFACWMVSELCKKNLNQFPSSISVGDYFLVYNHFDGERHGFILLQK